MTEISATAAKPLDTGATSAPGLLGWLKEGTTAARRSLLAASLGWMLDGFDIMLYALVVSALLRDLSISTGVAGLLGSLTLVASGIGGIVFGLIADRYGRRPALIGSSAHLLDLHGRMRPGAIDLAARRVPLPARSGYGWRVDQRRRHGLGDLARPTSWKSCRPHAERLGRRVRGRRARCCLRAPAIWLARGVPDRHFAGLADAVDSSWCRGV